MKLKLIFILPLLLAIVTGCKKLGNTAVTPPVPSGTFTGQFRYLHRHSNNVPFDTLKANITLKMITPTNTFEVSGDTAIVHAGSKGPFTMASPYIVFSDLTYPKTGVPAKQHLNGAYVYYFDGNVFQMLAYSADTLGVQYDLKKTSN